MQKLVIEDGVLFFDPATLKDIGGRAILLMQPGKYFPGRISAVEIVDLLMAFSQMMISTEKEYVFVADMRHWGNDCII